MSKNRNRTRRIYGIILTSFIIIWIGSVSLQMLSNRHNAWIASEMILQQLEDVIEENKESYQTLLETLKEEYTLRAETVANLLEMEGRLYQTTEEYRKIAKQLRVDEIHIINTGGCIVAGTNPEYFGYSFSSGEQMGYFKPMLTDKTLSMCQDMVPNTAEGKMMMYAIVWNSSGTAMIQIGITPSRLLAKMNSASVENLVRQMPITSGMNIFLLNATTGKMLATTRQDVLLYELQDSDRLEEGNLQEGKRYRTSVKISDRQQYLVYEKYGEYNLAVSYDILEANQNLIYVAATMFLVLVLSFLIIFYITERSIAAIDKNEEELKQAKEAAERANAAKTGFLSRMSHDIRTPMNAIIGFTTLAVSNIDDKERVRDYLGKILSSSNHLLSLINDILDMSRIESGKIHLEETEVSLSEVLHDLKTIISGQIHAKQLELYMDVMDVTNEDVYCDKTRLNQVLLNLLSNAIKFTPAGGTVSVRLREYSGTQRGCELYEIRVKDNGIGMSQKFVQKIFSPFERERTSTVSRTQGTGLGMAITKNIVDMMGGTIEVQTEQGKGTEFIIRLPLRIQPENHRIEKIAELEGLKALVVDDDFNTCDSVTKMLVKVGMRSEWTLSGKEAVLRARQSMELGDAFHAYIIDWRLPDMNGIEVTRQIRSLGDDTPIIILTAYDWSDIEVEARAAGVTAFCSKPMFMSDIRETLMAAIGQKQAGADDNILPAADSDFRGRHILLVEDNELNREIAVALLSEYGFQVDTAEDGAEAVEKVKNSRPGDYDLVLMDVQMPVMNGYEATEQIRSLDDPALAGITILAMTANAFDEDRKKALACGMDGFLSKPIVIEELISTLQNSLG